VVQLDCVFALPAQLVEDFTCDSQNLSIGDHRIVGTGNVEIALVELAHAALGHGGLVTAVDLCDVVALDVLDGSVHGEPSGEGDGQVVTQRAQLSTLVGEVVDELAVLTVLAREDLLELEDRTVGSVESACRTRHCFLPAHNSRIDSDSTVTLEDVGDGAEDLVADDHVLALPVLSTLGYLELEATLVSLVFSHVELFCSV